MSEMSDSSRRRRSVSGRDEYEDNIMNSGSSDLGDSGWSETETSVDSDTDMSDSGNSNTLSARSNRSASERAPKAKPATQGASRSQNSGSQEEGLAAQISAAEWAKVERQRGRPLTSPEKKMYYAFRANPNCELGNMETRDMVIEILRTEGNECEHRALMAHGRFLWYHFYKDVATKGQPGPVLYAQVKRMLLSNQLKMAKDQIVKFGSVKATPLKINYPASFGNTTSSKRYPISPRKQPVPAPQRPEKKVQQATPQGISTEMRAIHKKCEQDRIFDSKIMRLNLYQQMVNGHGPDTKFLITLQCLDAAADRFEVVPPIATSTSPTAPPIEDFLEFNNAVSRMKGQLLRFLPADNDAPASTADSMERSLMDQARSALTYLHSAVKGTQSPGGSVSGNEANPDAVDLAELEDSDPVTEEQNRESFRKEIIRYHHATHASDYEDPMIDGDCPIDMWYLFKFVAMHGGPEQVSEKRQWLTIGRTMLTRSNLSITDVKFVAAVAQRLKRAYARFIQPYAEYRSQSQSREIRDLCQVKLELFKNDKKAAKWQLMYTLKARIYDTKTGKAFVSKYCSSDPNYIVRLHSMMPFGKVLRLHLLRSLGTDFELVESKAALQKGELAFYVSSESGAEIIMGFGPTPANHECDQELSQLAALCNCFGCVLPQSLVSLESAVNKMQTSDEDLTWGIHAQVLNSSESVPLPKPATQSTVMNAKPAAQSAPAPAQKRTSAPSSSSSRRQSAKAAVEPEPVTWSATSGRLEDMFKAWQSAMVQRLDSSIRADDLTRTLVSGIDSVLQTEISWRVDRALMDRGVQPNGAATSNTTAIEALRAQVAHLKDANTNLVARCTALERTIDSQSAPPSANAHILGSLFHPLCKLAGVPLDSPREKAWSLISERLNNMDLKKGMAVPSTPTGRSRQTSRAAPAKKAKSTPTSSKTSAGVAKKSSSTKSPAAKKHAASSATKAVSSTPKANGKGPLEPTKASPAPDAIPSVPRFGVSPLSKESSVPKPTPVPSTFTMPIAPPQPSHPPQPVEMGIGAPHFTTLLPHAPMPVSTHSPSMALPPPQANPSAAKSAEESAPSQSVVSELRIPAPSLFPPQ